MFRLLIVDDEPLAVKGVEMGVEWVKYDIDTIFTAYNIRQAKEILLSNPVDIMLCDIEMPQGSGLELLAWVRANSPRLVSIIFTCHRDFSYAKEAMHLGSFDYLLKPIAFEELEEVVSKAIRKIIDERKILENSQYGELWRKYQPYMTERFWLDIIHGNISPNDEDIIKAANDRHIFVSGMELRPCLFDLNHKDDRTSLHESKTLLSEIKTCISALSPLEQLDGILLNLEDGKVLSIAENNMEWMNDSYVIDEACCKVIDMYKKMYGGRLSCYAGINCTPAGLAQTVGNLLEMSRNNVTMKSGLFRQDQKIDRPAGMSLSSELLTTLLFKEDFENFLSAIEGFLTDPVNEEKIDAAFLKQFHQNVLQILYSCFNRKNYHAHQNLSDYVSTGLFEKATRSVYDMMEWIKHVVARLQELKTGDDGMLSVIEKVKRYIAFHIDQNLSREDMANYVYLNPDYLARLFKKETGMTLIEYYQDERMKYAKTLLDKTDWGIGTVAAHMGYSNFSHFARAFRERTGMSPGEYKANQHNALT